MNNEHGHVLILKVGEKANIFVPHLAILKQAAFNTLLTLLTYHVKIVVRDNIFEHFDEALVLAKSALAFDLVHDAVFEAHGS